jgi:hypothetical protein
LPSVLLWLRLQELQSQKITRDALLLKIGAAKKEAGRVYALVDISLPQPREPVNPKTFTFRLRKDKLREMLLFFKINGPKGGGIFHNYLT